jgi:hypothetical protein
MKRRIMSKKSSRRNFKRGAKTHPKNTPKMGSRGGIRL